MLIQNYIVVFAKKGVVGLLSIFLFLPFNKPNPPFNKCPFLFSLFTANFGKTNFNSDENDFGIMHSAFSFFFFEFLFAGADYKIENAGRS